MSRWEIVQTAAPVGWHARLVASNGKIIASTENYTRRSTALSAIATAAEAFGVAMSRPPATDPNDESGTRVIGVPRLLAGEPHSFDVREVDERPS